MFRLERVTRLCTANGKKKGEKRSGEGGCFLPPPLLLFLFLRLVLSACLKLPVHCWRVLVVRIVLLLYQIRCCAGVFDLDTCSDNYLIWRQSYMHCVTQILCVGALREMQLEAWSLRRSSGSGYYYMYSWTRSPNPSRYYYPQHQMRMSRTLLDPCSEPILYVLVKSDVCKTTTCTKWHNTALNFHLSQFTRTEISHHQRVPICICLIWGESFGHQLFSFGRIKFFHILLSKFE